MKYRICKRKEGYYPQVKKWWWLWWMRIGKHPDGFGLYVDLEHPRKSLDSAEEILFEYRRNVENKDDTEQYFYY